MKKGVKKDEALSPRVHTNVRIRRDLKEAFFERKKKLQTSLSLCALLEKGVVEFLEDTDPKKKK